MSNDPYQDFREKFQAALKDLIEKLIPIAERIDLIITKKGEDLADDVEQWLKERS